MEEELEGFRVVAQSLVQLGVKYMFGVVGIPVVEVAVAAQQEGIEYVGMRNEQAACYAAQAMGYLTGWPAACLAVSGPGVLHCMGGLANAKENCWPLVLLGGACEAAQEGVGAFQEWPQMLSVSHSVKYSARPASVELIPRHLERAVRSSVYGRPGPTYIDLPGDLLNTRVMSSSIQYLPPPPHPPVIIPELKHIQDACAVLRSAAKPLIIVGKGAAYGRAEDAIQAFAAQTNLPVLATPMGKGVLPDNSPLVVGAARSTALGGCDTVLLLGARLNWMLHFGVAPRWANKVKIIQVDICAEELHNSVQASVALQGDIRSTVKAMTECIAGWSFPSSAPWWKTLRDKIGINTTATQALADDPSEPLNYYAAFKPIVPLITKDTYIVSEGANTMDIGRTMLPNFLPRHRLDAGTFGTMGLGPGFAIATALYVKRFDPGAKVLCVEGDSAFGFSGMELETIVRYKLPIITVIINNNGIYSGFESELYQDIVEGSEPSTTSPPTALLPLVRYDKMMHMVGKEGYSVHTQDQISKAVKAAMEVADEPTIINVMINPMAGRKAQQHEWLTRAKL